MYQRTNCRNMLVTTGLMPCKTCETNVISSGNKNYVPQNCRYVSSRYFSFHLICSKCLLRRLTFYHHRIILPEMIMGGGTWMRLIATSGYICIELAMNVLISIITKYIISQKCWFELYDYYVNITNRILFKYAIWRQFTGYCDIFKTHNIQVTILYTNLVVSYVGIGTLSYNMTCIFL